MNICTPVYNARYTMLLIQHPGKQCKVGTGSLFTGQTLDCFPGRARREAPLTALSHGMHRIL